MYNFKKTEEEVKEITVQHKGIILSAFCIFLFLFSFSFISAEKPFYNYNNPGQTVDYNGTYVINVNNTEHLQGYTVSTLWDYFLSLMNTWTNTNTFSDINITGSGTTCPEGYIADPWGGCAVGSDNLLNTDNLIDDIWLVETTDSGISGDYYMRFTGGLTCVVSSTCSNYQGSTDLGSLSFEEAGLIQQYDPCAEGEVVYFYDSAGCSSPSPTTSDGQITLNGDTITNWNQVNGNSSDFWDLLDTPADISIFDLGDVQDSANDLDFLQYNSTTGQWHPVSLEAQYFNATSLQTVAGTGAGTIGGIQAYNGYTYNITETASNPGLDFRVNFTGVDTFDGLQVRWMAPAGGNHLVLVQIWDYDDSDWEDYDYFSPTGTFILRSIQVPDPQDHIQSGKVQIRFFIDSTGNPSHMHEIDWVTLSKGAPLGTGTETDPVWSSEKGNYYNTTQVDALIPESLWNESNNTLYPKNPLVNAINLTASWIDNAVNGDFGTGDFTGWEFNYEGGDPVSLVSGQAYFDNTEYFEESMDNAYVPTIGQTYRVSFEYDIEGDGTEPVVYITFAGSNLVSLNGETEFGTYEGEITATTAEQFNVEWTDESADPSNGFYFDNLEILQKEEKGFQYEDNGTIYGDGFIKSDGLGLLVDKIVLPPIEGDIIPLNSSQTNLGSASKILSNVYSNYIRSNYYYGTSGTQRLAMVLGDIKVIGGNFDLTSHELRFDSGTARMYVDITDKLRLYYSNVMQFNQGKGDINVSTVYYDTLTAKSPIIMCSEDWCSVNLPKNKKTYYIRKDENWNLLEMTDEKGNDMYAKGKVTLDENGYITRSSEQTILEILNKTKRLNEKAVCENTGHSWNGYCYDLQTQQVTYEQAVTLKEFNITNETEVQCQKLNSLLQVVTGTCTEEVVIGIEQRGIFKEGCYWDENYYCKVEVLI